MAYINHYLSGPLRRSFHMPGHKRNSEMFPSIPLDKDITEIEGADNLHCPTGIIKAAMEDAATLWGAKRSVFLVNGSSCGLLAGLGTLCRRGDKVLVARNCHRSVFHGIELLGLKPVYLWPEYLEDLGFYGAVSVDTVKAALDADGDIRAAVITSPTYEGLISDMPAICGLCHSRGVKVLADGAHGAHLDLSPYFTGGSVSAGADITVQSLHKTMPALTQTAILHVGSDDVDIDRLMHKLRVFESSSPSYILMQSAEHSVEMAKSKERFKGWADLIKDFENKISGLKNIRLSPGDRHHDPSKLVFTGVDGVKLGAFLRRFGVEPEMAVTTHLIAMTGMGNTREDYDALAEALKKADLLLPPTKGPYAPPPFCHGDAFCSIEEGLDLPFTTLPPAECVGRVAAEYVWAYPPGIPLLIPGERITEAFLKSDLNCLESDSGLLPEGIKVLI